MFFVSVVGMFTVNLYDGLSCLAKVVIYMLCLDVLCLVGEGILPLCSNDV